MVKYEITYEAKGDRFFPGIRRTCKYTTYGYDELGALVVSAYDDYRAALARLLRGRETIIFFEAHPSPYFSMWARRNGMWIDPEPIYHALYRERVIQTPIHIGEINTGDPGCSEKYYKQLQEKYNYRREKKSDK
jgi:hypothetical protein